MAEALLLINACTGDKKTSRTYRLSETVIEKIKAIHGEMNFSEILLEQSGLLPIDNDIVQKRTLLADKRDFDDRMFDAAKQIAGADYIVIAAPYWDMSFPSVLKIYIENIMVKNLTFQYTETGVQGLCHAKKLVYVTTSGGYIQSSNYGYEYIAAVANTIGVDSVDFVCAEGLDIAGNDAEKILFQAQEKIRKSDKI